MQRKVGDEVCYKGFPDIKMIIEQIDDDATDDDCATCGWFDRVGVYHSEQFFISLLIGY